MEPNLGSSRAAVFNEISLSIYFKVSWLIYIKSKKKRSCELKINKALMDIDRQNVVITNLVILYIILGYYNQVFLMSFAYYVKDLRNELFCKYLLISRSRIFHKKTGKFILFRASSHYLWDEWNFFKINISLERTETWW